jgi:hypothetical protein
VKKIGIRHERVDDRDHSANRHVRKATNLPNTLACFIVRPSWLPNWYYQSTPAQPQVEVHHDHFVNARRTALGAVS